MSDMYQAVFQWPYTDATHVILTGTFDQWSRSIPLSKVASGFEATVNIPWGQKVAYKFIVDGRWTTNDGHPVELDPLGNLNNILVAPPQPVSSAEPVEMGKNADVVDDAGKVTAEDDSAAVTSNAPPFPPTTTVVQLADPVIVPCKATGPPTDGPPTLAQATPATELAPASLEAPNDTSQQPMPLPNTSTPNGHNVIVPDTSLEVPVPTSTATANTTAPSPSPSASAPINPVNKHVFPSLKGSPNDTDNGGNPSTTSSSSPSPSSKFGSTSSRKKRDSLLVKIKNVFVREKNGEKAQHKH